MWILKMIKNRLHTISRRKSIKEMHSPNSTLVAGGGKEVGGWAGVLSESSYLTIEGGERSRKTPDTIFWSPHTYTWA